MAREILFRGKAYNLTGNWTYGDLSHSCGETYISKNGFEVPTPNETVGQFTGLTDKNGKRIFEGDIAKYTNKDGTSVFYEVVWDNEFAALMFRFIGGLVRRFYCWHE